MVGITAEPDASKLLRPLVQGESSRVGLRKAGFDPAVQICEDLFGVEIGKQNVVCVRILPELTPGGAYLREKFPASVRRDHAVGGAVQHKNRKPEALSAFLHSVYCRRDLGGKSGCPSTMKPGISSNRLNYRWIAGESTQVHTNLQREPG